MVKRSAKSSQQSKLSQALLNHREDETDYGQDMADIPPGISRGVAQLVDAKIGTYQSGANEGEPFVYLGGTVITPKKVTYSPKVFANGKIQVLEPVTTGVEGLRTGKTLPICNTKNRAGKVTDLDENVDIMLNELRKLGADTSEVDEDSLKLLLEGLVEAGPFFHFSTRASKPSGEYPEPRTWESWFGSEGLEDYDPDTGDDVVDETVDEEEEDIEEEDIEEEDIEEEDTEDEVDTDSEDTDSEDTEEETLLELGEAADSDSERSADAAETLATLAEEAELDPDDYSAWVKLAKALQAIEDEDKTEEEEEEKEEEEEDEIPKKGDVKFYKPPRKQKAVEAEITMVSQGRETVNLKTLDEGKVYKGIPWDKLSEEE